jgi:hypothetical protein
MELLASALPPKRGFASAPNYLFSNSEQMFSNIGMPHSEISSSFDYQMILLLVLYRTFCRSRAVESFQVKLSTWNAQEQTDSQRNTLLSI